MASDFKPGDVVKLKSGGPKMTIDGIDDYTGGRFAKCPWFDGTMNKEKLFSLASLKHVEESAVRTGQAKPHW
jgi:uncharacterized protein YodC (DUF2158 family)